MTNGTERGRAVGVLLQNGAADGNHVAVVHRDLHADGAVGKRSALSSVTWPRSIAVLSDRAGANRRIEAIPIIAFIMGSGTSS